MGLVMPAGRGRKRLSFAFDVALLAAASFFITWDILQLTHVEAAGYKRATVDDFSVTEPERTTYSTMPGNIDHQRDCDDTLPDYWDI